MAGSFVLISVFLSIYIDKRWLALAVFVGVNLIQSAFTGFCPAEIILKRMGLK